MRRTPNRGEGIVTYFALVNKSGKSTLISLEELKRLHLQVRKQQAEIDFLKKAAAYFAKLPK